MYWVLVPRYSRTGQMFTTIERKSGAVVQNEWERVEWECLGQAADMADAKRRYGGFPVLERELG